MRADDVKGIIEGILFVVGEEGITKTQLGQLLQLDVVTVEKLLSEMKEQYKDKNRGIQLVELAGTYQLTTKKEHHPFFQQLVKTAEYTSLSRAALETLAIVAYKQPITRVEIEEIRGVKSEKALQTLVAKLLIKEVGRAEGTGRAILYGTTKEFLDYFGLRSLEDLPPLQEDDEHFGEETDLFFRQFEEEIDELLRDKIEK